MKEKRWQDWVMLVLGIWLFVSPFILQYADLRGTAALNSYVLGIAVVAFAVAALARPQMWEEWVNLALGIWLIISPFVLGFQSETVALWNHVILGLLIGGDAVSAMLEDRTGRKAVTH